MDQNSDECPHIMICWSSISINVFPWHDGPNMMLFIHITLFRKNDENTAYFYTYMMYDFLHKKLKENMDFSYNYETSSWKGSPSYFGIFSYMTTYIIYVKSVAYNISLDSSCTLMYETIYVKKCHIWSIAVSTYSSALHYTGHRRTLIQVLPAWTHTQEYYMHSHEYYWWGGSNESLV